MTDEKRRPIWYGAALFLFRLMVWGLAFVALGWFLLEHPKSPVPRYWQPRTDLVITDPITPFTARKLALAAASPDLCRAALETYGAVFMAMPDREDSEYCHIRGQIRLSRLKTATLEPIETRCSTALNLAMWEQHGLMQQVSRIHHLGSYNCRKLRTEDGESQWWSSHARAVSIDITGFTLGDGTRLTLLDNWADSAMLRAARDTACDWFGITLGPEFNALHGDHFHLETSRHRVCR